MTTPRMDPSLAKRFRSGRVCLDFAHTAETREWVEPELIYDQAGLERWLAHLLGAPAVRAEPGDLAAAHRLRAAVLEVARARTEDRPLAANTVEIVNTFAAAAPPIPQLTAAGTAAPLELTVTAGLSAIARDAIDLLTGPLGHRVRVCAADGCAFMFVDASRPGTRRWCSMERCGNLAKIRTHRDAKQAQPAAQ